VKGSLLAWKLRLNFLFSFHSLEVRLRIYNFDILVEGFRSFLTCWAMNSLLFMDESQQTTTEKGWTTRAHLSNLFHTFSSVTKVSENPKILYPNLFHTWDKRIEWREAGDILSLRWSRNKNNSLQFHEDENFIMASCLCCAPTNFFLIFFAMKNFCFVREARNK
jgi:hypothetical protein